MNIKPKKIKLTIMVYMVPAWTTVAEDQICKNFGRASGYVWRCRVGRDRELDPEMFKLPVSLSSPPRLRVSPCNFLDFESGLSCESVGK